VSGRDGSSMRSIRMFPWLLTISVLVLSGCGVPVPPQIPDTTPDRGTGAGSSEVVDRLVPSDDLTGQLTAQLELITTRITLVLDRLGSEEAVGLVLGAPGGGLAPGLLPAIAPDRAEAGSDDLITGLIALAGETGGERGRLVLELVRDPMLGDLGAWQRDPVGIITLLRSIAEAADDQAALDAELLELQGELTRALGYLLVIAATDDPDLATHATRQASGRLGVVLVALELAKEALERDFGDGGSGPDGRSS